jgi:hypothetical protein
MTKTKTTTSGSLDVLKAGSFFTYGGQKWILLEKRDGAALCLAHDVLSENRPFDENNKNDWTISTLREWLNEEYINELSGAGADPEAFLLQTVDLTSDDGLDEYGQDTCKLALISDAQYRRFRKLIPAASDWWWTVTPWSTASGASSYYSRYVDTSGALGNSSAYNGYIGVRPLCNLKSSILVSFEPTEAQAESGAEVVAATEITVKVEIELDETPEPQSKAAALDMIRHIAAAWGLTVEEVTEAINTPTTEGGAEG